LANKTAEAQSMAFLIWSIRQETVSDSVLFQQWQSPAAPIAAQPLVKIGRGVLSYHSKEPNAIFAAAARFSPGDHPIAALYLATSGLEKENVLNLLLTGAKNGLLQAQYLLGTELEKRGNHAEGREWILQAARGGFWPASLHFAHYYETPEEARASYARLAHLGSAQATYRLALFLFFGRGGDTQKEAALPHFLQAHRSGIKGCLPYIHAIDPNALFFWQKLLLTPLTPSPLISHQGRFRRLLSDPIH
jgi:TPR repeat protein